MSRLSDSLAGWSGALFGRFFGVLGVIALILLFVALLFPWDSVAKRVAFEISRASGGEIAMGDLSPALTARGPVLAATDVLVEHPAVDRLKIRTLELAPRFSTSWFAGEPTLRVWADSELAQVDGVLRLGESSSFIGHVDRVAIEQLPLRLDASGLALSGLLSADADVALDPSGQLMGSVDFESDSLLIQTPLLPTAIPFSRATGQVQVLESGATRIEEAVFEGPIVTGNLRGEIGMVHRSLSPPIDLSAKIRIIEPSLRAMAPAAGLTLSSNGEAELRLGGTVDAPEMSSVAGAATARSSRRGAR